MTDLRFLTKKQVVVESLRSEILTGSLAPGSLLRQEEVADRLGVSATPVREAFEILEAEGYLERRPHHSVIVAEKRFENVQDAYEIRVALESLAIRRALDKGDDGFVAELERAVEEEQQAMKKLDLHAVRRATRRFHQALVKAAASELLLETVNRLSAYTLFFIPLDRVRMRELHREHLELIAALKARDAERAVTILGHHMDGNIEAFRRDVAQKKGSRN